MTNAKRKICVISGSRAEYSRVKSLMRAIQAHPKLELITIVTGPHLLDKYGATYKDIEADGFKIDEKVYLVIEGENPVTMTKSVGLGIIELATTLSNFQPDIVVAPTDRFETLSVAISAGMMNIPIAHVQGGEVTGTIDESIRHAITKFAHIHFPATEKSRERIIRMGEDPRYVFNIGCPATDLILDVTRVSQAELFQHKTMIPKDGRQLDLDEPYLLLIQHPVTTEYGQGYQQIQETLQACKDIDMHVMMLWPNADAGSDDIVNGIRRFCLKNQMDKLFIYKHFSTDVFVNLLANAACMVGNSSAGIRETCYLGVPVVNIGSRQNSRERGENVMDVAPNAVQIKEAIQKQLAHGKYPEEYVYGDGTAGQKGAEILANIELKSVQKKITF